MPGGGWVATHEDITEQRQSEVKIEYMAHHDSLTDLANRVLLNDRLEQALGRVQRGKWSRSIISTSISSRPSTIRSAIPAATSC